MALFTVVPLPMISRKPVYFDKGMRRASVGATGECISCNRGSVGDLPSLPKALLFGGMLVFALAIL